MTEAESGIGLHDELDEGTMLFDYDLDGDQDLFIVYTRRGVKIWESSGDGRFLEATGIVDSPMTGLDLGMSAEDWDMDGDIDFTTRQVFRQNRWMEDGARHFVVAGHSIPSSHLTSATPAWGDWDKDGDLDCALGNWLSVGHFYENTLYDALPRAERRHFRVRAVRNSPDDPPGLETEYAAFVELDLLNVADGFRRRKFVASSHGYLNQNEYDLHFALPADPTPGDASTDVRFDVRVDFPSLPSEGIWRVDKHINPALGAIDLAELADREIKVYRCGQVVKDDVSYDPVPLAAPLLVSTAPLVLPVSGAPPPAPPVAAPDSDWYVGLAFDTLAASEPLRLKEIVLDGQLEPGPACSPGGSNIVLWDVTDPGSPFVVAERSATTSARNHRTRFLAETVLEPGRHYRLVARVSELRLTPFSGPASFGPLTVAGGLSLQDLSPCDGAAAAAAAPDPLNVPLAILVHPSLGREALDPIGNRLLMVKAASSADAYWPAIAGADRYGVDRCGASAGPCTPALLSEASAAPYSDTDITSVPGEHLWYKLRPVADCNLP